MVEAAGLEGTIRSGSGEGAFFLGLGWVRDGIREECGFDPYPGTLNVELTNPDLLGHWRDIRKLAGRPLVPARPGECGGTVIPVLVEGAVRGAVIVPDVTRYGEETLEVIAPICLRSAFGLKDGDRVRLAALIEENDPWPTR